MFKKMKQNNKGVALLIIILILGLTSFIFFFSFTRSNLNSVIAVDEQMNAMEARERVFSCMEEALLNLQKDSSFSTTTLRMDNYICSASFLSQGNGVLVSVSTTYENIIRGLKMEVIPDPIMVTSSREVL